MGFWDYVAVCDCPHDRWLDDEPDRWGNRTCALCEERVTTVLTEDLMLHTMNCLYRQSGHAEPYPDIGRPS